MGASMNTEWLERQRSDDARQASRMIQAWSCGVASAAVLLGGVVASLESPLVAELGPYWLPLGIILALWSAVQAQPYARHGS
jgi:hypothetical protein